jgi:hypothetical protein
MGELEYRNNLQNNAQRTESCRRGSYVHVVVLYDTVWSGKWVEMFRTDILPPYSEQNTVYCLSDRIFHS